MCRFDFWLRLAGNAWLKYLKGVGMTAWLETDIVVSTELNRDRLSTYYAELNTSSQILIFLVMLKASVSKRNMDHHI
jgi:hypothetical protein